MKPREVIPEGGGAAPEPELEPPALPETPVHRGQGLAHVVIPEGRTYLTTVEAAAYVRCASVGAFYHWYRDHGVRAYGDHGKRLFRRADLDRALEPRGQSSKALRYFRRSSHTRTA